VGNVESEHSFEYLPERTPDERCDGRCLCVDLHLRDKFVEREKNQKRQCERDEVLEKEVIDKRNRIGVDIVGNVRAFLDDPLDGCPHSGDGQRDQHDGPDDEQQDVFHEPPVEEGLLLVRSENAVYGFDHVRKQKAGCDERPCKAEPPEIGDIPGEILEPFEKGRVKPSKEFVSENIQTPESNF